MNDTPATLTPLTPITLQEYRAMQPTAPPSIKQLFERNAEKLVGAALAEYKDFDAFRKYKPLGLFLILPPWPDGLDLNQAVRLVTVGGKEGQNLLDPNDLPIDYVKVAKGFCLMTDIDDGVSGLNLSPSVSRLNIIKKGRSPYAVWEGIIHAIVFPEVFEWHNMDFVGSQYGSRSTPNMFLAASGPKLSAYWKDVPNPKWGAPSCGQIIRL